MMDNSSAPIIAFVATSAIYRHLWLAAYTWALYDWLINLDQEIDLVWRRRSGTWQSKSLYAFIRYYGLAIITFNLVVVMHTNWSAKFCHVYFYLATATTLIQLWGTQVALLLRLSVMYQRSFKVMATSTALFLMEVFSNSIIYLIDSRDLTPTHIPAPATGCYSTTVHLGLVKAYWAICLVFETYLCILALRSAYSHWKVTATSRPNILTILIRDSLVWYICLALCVFLNFVAFTTGTSMLTLAGIPIMLSTANLGGSRFLLNLRAAHFSSARNVTSTDAGYPHSTLYTETEGTVGMFRAFRSDFKDDGDDGQGVGTGSIEMGAWANHGPG